MNYSYNEGNKVYGRDLTEARYNALLETFYNWYPGLERKVKLGKNYFERDPNTAYFLEKRILEESGYIPDEDKYILDGLINAYKTTKIDLETCSKQTSESGCKNLKFKGMQRCNFEKKWFSYIRGGNCIISEDVIAHILKNLQSIVNINWEYLESKEIQNGNNNLPNPDELTKLDMANIIHDLSYHVKNYTKGKDLVETVEAIHGEKLLELTDQELLYYVYLFSFITYSTQFLDANNLMLINKHSAKLSKLIRNKPSKENLINYIMYFFSINPHNKTKTKGWKYGSLIGPLIILFLLNVLIPAVSAKTMGEIYKQNEWKMKKSYYSDEYDKNKFNYIIDLFEAVVTNFGGGVVGNFVFQKPPNPFKK
jgi:hypothetical protein